MITNDDPFETQAKIDRIKKRQASAKPKAKQNRNRVPPVWCANVLAVSYKKVIERRKELRGRLSLQSIAAGLPKELTGDVSRNSPQRAVLAICDSHYRLLGMQVGVPDAESLLTMIEDGEEVITLAQMHTEQSGELTKAIVQRSHERLGRTWQRALDQTDQAIQGEDGKDQKSESFSGLVQLLSQAYDPVYLEDVRLRFEISDVTVAPRLVVLEQHTRTRRPWCEAMIPFVANHDFSLLWRELVETIWGFPPITSDSPAQEFLAWYDSQAKTDSIVLSLHQDLHFRIPPWSSRLNEPTPQKEGWGKVHEMATTHRFRKIQLQELATLIHQRSLSTIDIVRPSLARYVFFDAKKKKPYVVRQLDPPGRFAGMLKRSKMSLVQP